MRKSILLKVIKTADLAFIIEWTVCKTIMGADLPSSERRINLISHLHCNATVFLLVSLYLQHLELFMEAVTDKRFF